FRVELLAEPTRSFPTSPSAPPSVTPAAKADATSGDIQESLSPGSASPIIPPNEGGQGPELAPAATPAMAPTSPPTADAGAARAPEPSERASDEIAAAEPSPEVSAAPA